jgi:molybdopterin molybdotransferase
LGFGEINVARKPVVGIFSTGNELVGPGSTLKPGQIFESNCAALIPLLEASGAAVRDLGIVRDDLATTTAVLKDAFTSCDAVITSGGVSVGEHDHVKRAFELAGGSLDLWRVSMKPGKPFAFGKLGGKCLFGLPGNPVSAMVTCFLLVRPALLRMQGAASILPRSVRSELAEPLANDGNRRHYVRVRFTGNGRVERAGLQASHALGGFASSDGLVAVPPTTTLSTGEAVEVQIWE